MRKVLLFLLGLTPFFFGGVLNWAMTNYTDILFPYLLLGIGFLLVWFCFAFFPGTRDWKETVFFLNLPAGIVLILLFIQQVILSAYWRNGIGIWTQFFFLPLLNIGFRLSFWFHNVFAAYVVAFVLMAAVSYFGVKCRNRIGK